MAKKSSLTKSLEIAQKNAVRELEKTRKRIRAQKKISVYEYAVLHEDTVREAKYVTPRIESFLSQLDKKDGPTLLLMCQDEKSEGLVLAMTDVPGIELQSDGEWQLSCLKFIGWDDARPSVLQTMSGAETTRVSFSRPIHRILGGPGTFLVCGEDEVASRLLPIKKREGGPRDRFNFFYGLTKKLGYELKDKKLKKRVEEERERVAGECRSHLKSLAGVLDEFFVHGARLPYNNFKGDASPMLLSRAKGLATSMGDSIRECKLYGVDTEQSREIIAFGKRWITYFDLVLDAMT